MIISLIAALDQTGGIGRAGGVPWRLSADLRLFKRLTMGHHLLMGRKTYESIGRNLPGRISLILTRQPDFHATGDGVVRSLEEAVTRAELDGERELYIIGGGEVFSQALPQSNQLYLTRVETVANCDVFFPPILWEDWVELERGFHPADQLNEHAFSFHRYWRKDRQSA